MFAFSNFRWIPSGRCLCHLATLLAYICAAIGMPIGEWGRPTSGCQCGEEQKAAGRCCCVKKLAHIKQTASCCDLLSKPKACCASSSKPKPRETCCKTKECPEQAELPCLSACSCDGEPIGGVLCCSDPRLLSQTAEVPSDSGLAEEAYDAGVFLPQRHISPETPPPKACA